MGIKIRNFIEVICVLAIISMFTGCSDSCDIEECNFPPEPQVPSFIYDHLNEVNIFLDATPSMKGFVLGNAFTSAYTQVVNDIERLIVIRHSDANIRFYKFGEKIQELNRDEFKSFMLPAFYRVSEGTLNTDLHVVLDTILRSLRGRNMYVVITDLFQTDNDIEKILSTIARMAKKEIFIGMLLVESEFRGKVYDVGYKRYSFWWGGTRPFYVLCFSKNPIYIEELFDLLLQEHGSTTKMHALIWGPYLAKKNLKIDVVQEKTDPRKEIKEEEIKEEEEKEEKKLILRGVEKRDNITISFEKMGDLIKFMHYEPQEPLVISYGCNQGGEIEDLFVVNGFDWEEKQLRLKVKKDDKKVKAVDVVFYGKGKIPKFINKYDMNIAKLSIWVKDPKSFDGSTTYNLKRFVKGVFDIYRTPLYGRDRFYACFE